MAPYTTFLGNNVIVLDPSMDMKEVQKILDNLHAAQAHREFGSERYAILVKPGEYDLDITVDYYVQAAGLGRVPGDVRINGAVQSISSKHGNKNVTTMFWRAAENFLVRPDNPDQPIYWATSQAAPYRRMHIQGSVQFDLGGWASGGFLANSIIEGQAGLTTGQQWFTRNSELGSWGGGNWNRTFVGSLGTPGEQWPEHPTTIVSETPVIREKPFLVTDEDGRFSVFQPALAHATKGVSWKNGPEDGQDIPVDAFHIAFPGNETAASLNAALDSGKHILFTPGIYLLEDTIRVTRPDTVIFGLGLPTLIPQTGKVALETADVPGIVLAGLMFDAGPAESPALVKIGPTGATAMPAENPTSLHDIFFRVGGAAPGKAEACLIVNSNHVLMDHLWIWRADHGAGADWNVNTSRNGLVVNGDDVTIYGLFNEHFQGHQTLWSGERGRVYFYQSEIPYDPPTQESWMDGSKKGFASYKVAEDVQSHQAWGLGIYSFFGVRGDTDPGVRLQSAIECPEGAGIQFTHITTFAGGFGGIDHPVNDHGEATNAKQLKFFDGIPQ
jgi:hypothetical protein